MRTHIETDRANDSPIQLSNKVGRGWRLVQRLIFLAAFVYLCSEMLTGFGSYVKDTLHGTGLIKDFMSPWTKGDFHECVLTLIALAISVATIWEIARVLVESLRKESAHRFGWAKLRAIFVRLIQCFQSTFLSALVSQWLPKLIALDVFWVLQPHFQKHALFTVGLSIWGWIYAVLAWDLATWVYHFSAHRVRLLWCLHSPHHASEDLTITTAWVHFFAEGWYTTMMQLVVLTLLGVPGTMIAVLVSFEVTWGTLIHVGERTLPTGRLGALRFFVMTPSYHRVHHARNPLYLDTNFCTLLPFWDWVLGTLQPIRDEVKLQYGVVRKIDAAEFLDFYFGEFVLLWRDLRNAKNWRERISYLVKPPGWSPDSVEHTAEWMRTHFLKQRPELRVWHWRTT